MMSSPLECSKCGRRVVQQGVDGKLKVRTRMLVFAKGQLSGTVVCPHCAQDVEIDVRIGPNLLKALARPVIKIR
jgi:hypothetical protein